MINHDIEEMPGFHIDYCNQLFEHLQRNKQEHNELILACNLEVKEFKERILYLETILKEKE